MKRMNDIVRPVLPLVLGVTLLLSFMNQLGANGVYLALGIIAVVFAAYYIAYAIIRLFLGKKLPPKALGILDLVGGVALPIFLFVEYLLITIDLAQNLGATGWVIVIFMMASSLAVAVFRLLTFFVPNLTLKRIARVSAGLFIVALVISELYDITGNPNVLGNITLPLVLIYIAYCVTFLPDMLLPAKEEEKPSEEATEEPEPAAEPKPVDEIKDEPQE